MLDTTKERPIPIQEAAGVGRTHVSTVLRWILRGVPGPDGRRVRLSAIRLGAKWYTSREALQRFGEEVTPRIDGESLPPPRSPSARERATARAKHALKMSGI